MRRENCPKSERPYLILVTNDLDEGVTIATMAKSII